MKTKLVSGIATGALLLGAFAPAAFASTVKIHGNGQSSNNKVNLTSVSSSSTKQVNKTAVFNMTGVMQNTGDNKANSNTKKGTVSVMSGDATSTVTNTTTAGANSNTSSCGCLTPSSYDLTISGNGDKSMNTINVTDVNSSSTTQVNKTIVVNGTFVLQNTGGNTANGNTGGDVSVMSGDATSTVTNDTMVGANSL